MAITLIASSVDQCILSKMFCCKLRLVTKSLAKGTYLKGSFLFDHELFYLKKNSGGCLAHEIS